MTSPRVKVGIVAESGHVPRSVTDATPGDRYRECGSTCLFKTLRFPPKLAHIRASFEPVHESDNFYGKRPHFVGRRR